MVKEERGTRMTGNGEESGMAKGKGETRKAKWRGRRVHGTISKVNFTYKRPAEAQKLILFRTAAPTEN